jgi:hypothetical protein
MVRVRKDRTVGVLAGVVILSVVCRPALGRDVKLTIYPQKMSAEAGKYSLLPPQASLTDGDGVPLYNKAAPMVPDEKFDEQVQQYLKMPIDQLPADQVEQLLKRYLERFKCLAQAVKCRNCEWPAGKPETIMVRLPGYRRLAYAVRLWARSEIAQENYEGAILAMQTGFGMGKHLTQAPTLLRFITGQGIADMMRTEVEEFVQAKDAPNLYAALAALPKPFTDVEKAIAIENEAVSSEPPTEGVARELFEMNLKSRAELHNKIRAVAKRLDRDLAALQCIEAIRSYAGAHSGQLPQTLADIKEASIPKDPVTGETFRYTRTGATAVLESPAPAGGDEKDAVRYEITVRN